MKGRKTIHPIRFIPTIRGSDKFSCFSQVSVITVHVLKRHSALYLLAFLGLRTQKFLAAEHDLVHHLRRNDLHAVQVAEDEIPGKHLDRMLEVPRHVNGRVDLVHDPAGAGVHRGAHREHGEIVHLQDDAGVADIPGDDHSGGPQLFREVAAHLAPLGAERAGPRVDADHRAGCDRLHDQLLAGAASPGTVAALDDDLFRVRV